MTVEQENIVDFVGIEKLTNQVVLTIADHLQWVNTHEHLLILQGKLNSYLRFIESDELIEEYPKAYSKQPVIEVVFKYTPSADAITFLERIKEVIENAKIFFKWKVLES
jgi:hypothetical protein